MQHGTAPRGRVKKILIIVLSLAILGVGAWYVRKKTRPRVVDARVDTNTDIVPPPGIAPFDPKILMDALATRTTADKFRFAVLGDTKHARTLPAFMKYLEGTIKPDFVLTTGDMVAVGGGRTGPGHYELLTSEVGKSMRMIPWWPSIGNHEVAGNPVFAGRNEDGTMRNNQQTGIENFKRFYNLKSDYYSFSFRNCYFIALSFPYPDEKETVWLEGELRAAKDAKKHIIIFNHTPFYTVGTKGSDDVPNKETAVTRLFEKYGVRAVFSGHDHGYYRTVRKGIPYFISAGGGAQIYAAKRLKEGLPEDVYYYGIQETYKSGGKRQYMLHRGGATPDKITEGEDQFLCYVDVDGDKITCVTKSVKDETWDEIELSK